MTQSTPNLGLPYILPAQAQKHVTHNEAIRALDALVQLSVRSRTVREPPSAPTDGDRYIVPAGAAGPWGSAAQCVAAFQDGAWAAYVAREGWLAWIEDEHCLCAFDGSEWIVASSASLNPAALVGINTTADSTNRLAVSASASLFTHAGSDHRQKINKAAAADTASVVFQTAYSGRAEVGLSGDDNFHFKVSADGASWQEALIIDAATGALSFPATNLNEAAPNWWKGKRWAALGTSITQSGIYADPLAILLDVELSNLGVAGGRIGAHPAGGGLEISARLADVSVDADLVTIEAGINDFRSGVPLGTVADVTAATFHGALFKAGADLLAANPARVIGFMTPYTTVDAAGPDWRTPNANGNTLLQFQTAVREAARRLGCPVLDVGGESGIGAQSASLSLADGLHPTPSGGFRIAQYLNDKLRVMRPWQRAVATPVFNPGSGSYSTPQTVAISCATPGANVHVTQDGTVPTASSPIYGAPLLISASTTLKAIAVKTGLANSPVATAAIAIGEAYSPARLGPAAWFDSSDLSTLFQDAGGSVPVSRDGDAVALIRDKSGSGRHLYATAPDHRPIYKTLSGLSWLGFAGTGMALSSRYTTPVGNWAIAWASRKADTSINGGMVWGTTGTANNWAGDNILGFHPDINVAGMQVDGAFGSASATTDHVVVINVAGGALTMYQDGVPGATTVGVTALSGDGITFQDPSYIMKGRIYQLMLVPRALTIAEIMELTTWLKEKAGMTTR